MTARDIPKGCSTVIGLPVRTSASTLFGETIHGVQAQIPTGVTFRNEARICRLAQEHWTRIVVAWKIRRPILRTQMSASITATPPRG